MILGYPVVTVNTYSSQKFFIPDLKLHDRNKSDKKKLHYSIIQKFLNSQVSLCC